MYIKFKAELSQPIIEYEKMKADCIAMAKQQLTESDWAFTDITWVQLVLKEFNRVEFKVDVMGLHRKASASVMPVI